MELTEFAQLIACNSTNIAKNTFSYLVGNGQKNADWDKALANLYKSFPKELKEGKQARKEFFPVILKYLYSYPLSKENIEIFNEYADLISAEDKDKLKVNNPNWVWDKEPEVIFKNPLAFVRAIPRSDILSFIEKYEEQFNAFVQTKKDKINQHFDSHSVWTRMMREDYIKFNQFCKKYNFNNIDILQENLNEHTMLSYMGVLNDNHIDLFLKDINEMGKDKFLGLMKNFCPNYIERRGQDESVFDSLVETIRKREYTAAIKFMVFFDKELNDYVKLLGQYGKESNNFNLSTPKDFENVVKAHIEYSKDRNYWSNKNSRLGELLENKEWFKFFATYDLVKELKGTLKVEENVPKKKVKI